MGEVAGMQADWFQAHCRQQLLLWGSRLSVTAGRNSFSVNKPASTDIFRRLCDLHVSISRSCFTEWW